MKRVKSRLGGGLLIAVAALLVAASLTGFWSALTRRGTPEPPPGRDIFQGRHSEDPDPQLLAVLSWPDVVPTAEASSADHLFARKVINLTGPPQRAPALYLRGLLLSAASDLEGALEAFDLVPVEEIPPALLYAPFRFHAELRPAGANPYLARLVDAVKAQAVAPIIQARVLATTGRLEPALENYLKTDPASWTSYDLRAFRSFRSHAALANSSAVLIQGALKAGRVPPPLRQDLAAILNESREPNAVREQRDRLLEQIRSNDQLRQAALKGATRQVAARHSFANRKYRDLLAAYKDELPAEIPDESVLLLTLSAARVEDTSGFHQWSQELKRRYPTAAVERWLEELHKPIP